MSTSERDQLEARHPGQGRSFYAGIMAAAFSSLGLTLAHPLIVLPLFLASVTDSLVVVVIPPILLAAGRLIVAPLGRDLVASPAGRSWLIGAGLMRAILAGMLALIANRSEELSPDRVTAAFLIGFAAFAITDGLVTPMTSVAAQETFTSSVEALFLRLRGIFSGLAALLAAPVVASVLGSEGPGTPGNYTLLLAVATICFAVAVFFALPLRTTDPAEQAEPPAAMTPLAGIRGGRFALFRLVLGSAALFDPLLVLYAARSLSAEATTIGWMVAFFAVGGLVSTPVVWVSARRRGAKLTYQLLALSRLIAAVIVLAVPQIIETELWSERVSSDRTAAILFAASLFFVSASVVGLRTLEAEIGAPRPEPVPRVPRLVALVAAFAPLLGAWIVERTGSFGDAFLVGGGLALLGVLLSGILPERLGSHRPGAGRLPRLADERRSTERSTPRVNGRAP